MNWVVERMKEPSTYAGLAGVAMALGLSAESYEAISAIAVGVFSLIAVIVAEKGKLGF